MKQLPNKVRKAFYILYFFGIAVSYGQVTSKTFSENFKVNKDVTLDLNTSHADIEFETWNKNEVVVEAIIELDGATEEEAEDFFKNNPVKIMGNSSSIEISTEPGNLWSVKGFPNKIHMADVVVEIPEIPSLEPLFLDLEIPEMPEFPELMDMPPIPFKNFDYEAYQKDKEGYMKKWKEEFDDKFDEEYKEKMEVWSKKMAERTKQWQERMQARQEDRQRMIQERQKRLEEAEKQRADKLKEMQERRQDLMKERQEAQKEAQELRARAMEERKLALEESRKLREAESQIRRNLFISRGDGDTPEIFFMDGGGSKKNFKIKKTIRIKMPKDARLKMNVRHGEVKLAENTINIQATLSYARLLASAINGTQSNITARYSPVIVKTWNDGTLKADFSEEVNLFEVENLDLSANSSDITIDRLLKQASISNSLGALRINAISGDFKKMDLSVRNGEITCELPPSSYVIEVNSSDSEIKHPAYLVLNKSNSGNREIRKGYHQQKDAGRSITIHASYSDVILEK